MEKASEAKKLKSGRKLATAKRLGNNFLLLPEMAVDSISTCLLKPELRLLWIDAALFKLDHKLYECAIGADIYFARALHNPAGKD